MFSVFSIMNCFYDKNGTPFNRSDLADLGSTKVNLGNKRKDVNEFILNVYNDLDLKKYKAIVNTVYVSRERAFRNVEAYGRNVIFEFKLNEDEFESMLNGDTSHESRVPDVAYLIYTRNEIERAKDSLNLPYQILSIKTKDGFETSFRPE